MIYDSITVHSMATLSNGQVHRSTVRFTVGYTDNHAERKIYPIVMGKPPEDSSLGLNQ